VYRPIRFLDVIETVFIGNEANMAGIENSRFDNSAEVSGAFSRIQEWVSRLSSGSRIESAQDDPAGLGVRELLRADIAELRQGSNNLSDGLSFVQTADASASQIQGNLVRMSELATQASTGTYSDQQKQIMQNEFEQLSEENARIVNDTEFNGIQVHSAKTTEVQFGQGQSIVVNTRDIVSVKGNLVTESSSVSERLGVAIGELSAYRGDLGATSNRLDKATEVVDLRAENLVAAESRISDLDMAQAVASKTAQDVVTQSAVAVQVHADSFSQVILKLLG
jgi:flagellin